MTTARFLRTTASAALAGALLLGLATGASAQTAGERVHSVRRLGGTTRFTAPVRTVDQLTKAYARPRTQRDVTTVLGQAGLPSLEAEVKRVIAPVTLLELTVAPGTALAWMALRRGGTRPQLLRPARWDGARPFAAFEFVIDDLKETYTFVIPQACGNLTLVSREPSREQARLDAEAAAARRADDARKAEVARRAEEPCAWWC